MTKYHLLSMVSNLKTICFIDFVQYFSHNIARQKILHLIIFLQFLIDVIF